MKDDEVYGEGNSYTAEYWQYDPRFGRRWNVDIVIKPWRSPYDEFCNNPIIRTDPKGDDDYFNAQGQYIGSDGEGSKIRIVSKPISDIKGFYKGDKIDSKIGKKILYI